MFAAVGYCFGPGQPGLPGHAGGGPPQHIATLNGCFALLWTAPVLATVPIMSRLTAIILSVFLGIAFLLTGRKVSTLALSIHFAVASSGVFVICCF